MKSTEAMPQFFSAIVLLVVGLVATVIPTDVSAAEAPRGGAVGWARLVAPGAHWDRHSRADPQLLQFVRTQTSLNLDPTWQPVGADRIEALCAYPLIFAHSVTDIVDSTQRENLREFLRRGGFLLIDPCRNPEAATDGPDQFLARHTALLTEWMPNVRVRLLDEGHAIYRSYFPVRAAPLGWYQADDPQKWTGRGIYGVFDGDRMISLISLSGLQCGWDRVGGAERLQACMQMLVNIYVYAMTRGAEVAPKP